MYQFSETRSTLGGNRLCGGLSVFLNGHGQSRHALSPCHHYSPANVSVGPTLLLVAVHLLSLLSLFSCFTPYPFPPANSLLHSPPSYPARTAFSPTSTSSRCFRSLLSLSLSFSLSPSRSPPRSHGLNPALELVNSPTLAPWSILALAPPFLLCNAHLPAQAKHSQAFAALMDLYELPFCAATGSRFPCKILTFNDRP